MSNTTDGAIRQSCGISTDNTKMRSRGLLLAISAGIVAGYVASLISMFHRHVWILDARGTPIYTDFVAVWSAGKLALKGAALAAYDGRLQHAAELAAIRHTAQGFLGWPYPPHFFLVAAPLALLPYPIAFLGWVALTLALYGATVVAITGARSAALIAFAAPWVLAGVMVGQNGFLTAALIGFALLNLEKRPVLAGVLFGLLTYKPQFGLLIPLALLAGRYRRAFLSAGVTAIVLVALSSAVFGTAVLGAFLRELPHTTETLLVDGAVGFAKLQSIYGVVRWLGLPDAAGWAAQATVSAACAAFAIWLWRSEAPFTLKAAGLSAMVLLTTPYVFAYDMAVLAVSIAFLFRQGPFDRAELATIGFALFSFLAMALAEIPCGVFASIGVLAVVMRRLTKAGMNQTYQPEPLRSARERINPSCTTEATSLPSRV